MTAAAQFDFLRGFGAFAFSGPFPSAYSEPGLVGRAGPGLPVRSKDVAMANRKTPALSMVRASPACNERTTTQV